MRFGIFLTETLAAGIWPGPLLNLARWGFFASGLVIYFAFTWDFRNVSAGGRPRPFHWPLFALGEVLGLGTFLHAVSTVKQQH